MPLSESTQVGSDVQLRHDRNSHGLRVQNGESSRGSHTFSVDEDQQFGQVQCWILKNLGTADQAYDSAAAIVNVFGGSKLSRNEKYRLIKIDTVIRQKRTGGTRASATKVQKGDGAVSEAFSDLVASVVDTGDVVDTLMSQILVKAQTLLSSGQTLRVQHEVGGSTTTGTEELDVYLYAIPVKA
jgi:hypothetical protein